MITFADDHEAELWRSMYLAAAAAFHGGAEYLARDAAGHADHAVREHRKRCGHQSTEHDFPGAIDGRKWSDGSHVPLPGILNRPYDSAEFTRAEIDAIRHDGYRAGRDDGRREHVESLRDIAATISANDSHDDILVRLERLAQAIEKGGEE